MNISVWEEEEVRKYSDPQFMIVGELKEKCRELFQIHYDSRVVKIQINFELSDIIINGFKIENNIRDIKVDHNSIMVIKGEKKKVKMILEFHRELVVSDIDNSKQLPFVIPKYPTYPKSTAFLAILTAYNQEKAWLYNNFILLWANIWVDTYEYWMDFKFGNENIRNDFCPMIKKEQIERGKLHRDNIINNITQGIDNGKYFLLLLDMYYIDKWWGENDKYHCTHQTLIYGYNWENKLFYVADFFYGKYQYELISYETLIESYISGLDQKSDLVEKYIMDEVFTYNSANYKVDIDIIKKQLEDFIFARDMCRYDFLNLYQRDNITYGFNFLSTIQKHLNSSIYNNDFLDIRPFQFIREFNEIMVERIIYIQNMVDFELEDVCEKFKNLHNMSNILVNLLIKYTICNKKDILYIAKEKFENFIEIEKEALLELYNSLEGDKTKECNDIGVEVVFEPIMYEYLSYYEKETELIFANKKEIEERIVKKSMYADGYLVDVFPYEHEKVGKVPNGRFFEKEEKGESVHFYGYDDENRLIIHSLIESEMTSYRTETYYTYSYNSDNIIKIGRYLDKETNEIKVGNIWVSVLQSGKPFVELYYGRDGIRNITIYNFLKGMLVSADVVSYKKINDEYKQLEYWKENYFYSDDQLKQMVIHKDNIIKTIYPAYGVPALDNYQIKLTIIETLRKEIKANVVESKKTISEICGNWNICLQKLRIEFKYKNTEKQNISTHDMELYKGYIADSDSNDIIPNIFRECVYELIYKEFTKQKFSGLLITMKNNKWVKSEKIH